MCFLKNVRMNRYISPSILADLQKKMVFIGGPRQVGKTTLSLEIAKQFPHFEYLNWDMPLERKKILNFQFAPETTVIVFDEIHKYENWKNHIKGFYDSNKEKYKILITGSARLDLYRKGGDSMFGRYFYMRLHPLSIRELIGEGKKNTFSKEQPFDFSTFFENEKECRKILDELSEFGGFPEPFFEKDTRFLQRWRRERKQRVLKDDIREISLIRQFSLFSILADLIPTKVGSMFSINSLKEDISVSHQTLSSWVDILENFYYLFRIKPYDPSPLKMLKREPKLFLWDWSEIEDEGTRFENLIGSHLLKWVHFLQDVYGEDIELSYYRDAQKREVDFLILYQKKPCIAVEVKLSDQKISTPLKYATKKLEIPHSFQVIKKTGVDFEKNGIRVISAEKFLTALV
jgi:predicted AAA+ superfamily ATPase